MYSQRALARWSKGLKLAMLLKVSCILPTGYGPEFAARATKCFMDQMYEGELELVIVDNNDTPLLPPNTMLEERVKYVRSKRMSVGALRNLGTRHATGEICITWDEDDWSAPNRVAEQVAQLLVSGKAVVGWHNILYWDAVNKRAYKYLHATPGLAYAMGTSQCYRKDWWEQHPFAESGVEDEPFSREALVAGQLASYDADQHCVALVHQKNVCSKDQLGRHKQWPEVDRDVLPAAFFEAIGDGQD